MSKTFRGQTATLTVDSVNVGALQDAEVTFTAEDEELRAQSLKRLDVQRTGISIDVSASYANFDIAGIKSLIGYDDTADEIEDTPQPPTFTMHGVFEAKDGSEVIEFDVTEVIFDDITFGWDGESYVTKDLSGTGTDIENLNDTST